MIDLNSFRKFSYYSSFETRSLNVLELMESIFVPVPFNPLNIEDYLFINSRFSNIFNVNFTVKSPLFPCISSKVNIKPISVLKLFCDHNNLLWEHLNNIPPRPLTSITKGPECAITHNFTKSVQADMDFR